MAIVVSDTSPLRALHHLGLIDLLADLFSEIVIPQAVALEMLQESDQFSSVDVRQWPFCKLHPSPAMRPLAAELLSLDAGEREAIRLAQELSANLLLIDESAGRSAARSLGIQVTGTLGILRRAKEKGCVPAVKPLIERLRDEIRFFVAPAFLEEFLRSAGE